MQMKEIKTFPLLDVKAADAAQGIVEAIVSVFNNVDHGGDRVMPGFFTESLQRKLPKGVWMHDSTQPVAKTLSAMELMPGDPRLPDMVRGLGGLLIRGQFNLETQRGREAFSDLKFGTVDEFSIGVFVTDEYTDPETGVRDLIKGELIEWSPVLMGMNPATALISVKAREPEVTIGVEVTVEDGEDGEDGDGQDAEQALKAGTAPGAKGLIDGSMAYAEHLQAVIDAAQDITARSKAKSALLEKQGRMLSGDNHSKLAALRDRASEIVAEIDALLEANTPAKAESVDDEGRKAWLRYIAATHGIELPS